MTARILLSFSIRPTCRNSFFKTMVIVRAFAWPTLLGMAYTMLAYRGDGLTIGGDSIIPLHPTAYLTKLTESFSAGTGLTSTLPPIFSFPPLPDILLFSFFRLLNLDIYTANKLYVFVLSTSSIISIYYLATTTFHDIAHKKLTGIVAACAYIFNPLIIADTYKTMVFIELSLVQTGFILFLAFTLRYFRTKRTRYSLYSALASFLMLSYPGLSAYRMVFFAFLGYVFFAVYYSAHRSRAQLSTTLSHVLKGAVIVLIISFALNGYWLIPFMQNASYFASLAATSQTTPTFNEYANIINTLRLMNSWSFYSGYVPYAEVFLKNPILIALTFAWPVFTFAPLLSKKALKKGKVLTISTGTIFTILFACASEYPLAQIYMTIVNVHVGPYYFLKPFYNTGAISQLLLTLEYALLIGLFSSLVYSSLIRRGETFPHSRRSIVAVSGPILIVIILASSSWPIITGDVMRNWYSPHQYGVRIPHSYWETNAYLEKISNPKHRTLLLPPTQVYLSTSWAYQGSSHFYNLIFNVPLITGNEIPYGTALDNTVLNQVYSIYYAIPEFNKTINVNKQIRQILTWQNDRAFLTEEFLQINFNSTYQVDNWHQVELKLSSTETWFNSTHMMVQFAGEFTLDRLQIGVGDANAYIEWSSAQQYVYQLNNGTFIPTEIGKLITRNSGTITLLINLKNPDRSKYSLDHVTSVWIRYFIAKTSDIATLRITKMLVASLSPNTSYYADLLAEYSIKYMLVDLAIKDGARNSPQLWLQMLSTSNYFKLIWQKDTIYIFENAMF